MLDGRTKEKLVTNAKGDLIFDRRRRAIRALLCALVFGSACWARSSPLPHPAEVPESGAPCPSLLAPPIQPASSLQAHAEPSPQGAIVRSVESVGMTVSDMDRSVDFYSHVLSFRKVSDVELAGSDYEHLEGVFGLRMRVARMQLGNEFIELTEYLAPKGHLVPADSRSNDRWFQHVAIVTSDMDHAYAWLRQNKVPQASTGPQTLPEYIRPAAGFGRFISRTLTAIHLKFCSSRRTKAPRNGIKPPATFFSGLIIRRSLSATRMPA